MTTAMKYQHLQRQRDGKGVVRLYWRHAHLQKPVRCDGEEGSPTFNTQYARLNAELAAWRDERKAAIVPKAPEAVRMKSPRRRPARRLQALPPDQRGAGSVARMRPVASEWVHRRPSLRQAEAARIFSRPRNDR